jgi:hypothetical protein
MHKYRRQSLIFLMGYLVMFFVVLLVSLFDLNRGTALFEIGMNPTTLNVIIIIFSILAIVRVVMEIGKIEGHSEYEKKLKDYKAGGPGF